MIQFTVSAPGRLSLFGEFIVMYGKFGLIGGINLRTTLTFIELSEHIIQLEFPQINLFLSVPLQLFLEFYRHCEENMELLHEHVLQFITSNPHFYSTENQKIILQVFFYLLIHIIYVEKIKITSFRVELFTKLMMDSDFIYLTPSTVCLAACFLHWSHLQNGARTILNNYDLKSIYLYAAKCEKISRKIELASVIVCTYGSIIQYKYTEHSISITWFPKISNEILLVDSRHSLNPEMQMQRLQDIVTYHRIAANSIFDKIEYATNMASIAFRRLGLLYINNESNTEIQRLKILLEHHMLMVSFIIKNFEKCIFLNITICLSRIDMTPARDEGV